MDSTTTNDTLQRERTSKIVMELLWWLVTAVIAWMVTGPYWKHFANDEYVIELLIFVVALLTIARYLFLLKYTFLARFQLLKFILIFASIPLAFWGIQEFFDFREFYETQSEGMVIGQSYFAPGVGFSERYQVLQRFLPIYSFFASSAILTPIVMPFRLLVSYWRVYNNTGTV